MDIINMTSPTPEILTNEIIEDVTGISVLCNEPFWNHSRAWESSTPQFGSCVERTVFVWIPCAVLWLISPVYFYMLKKTPQNPIPWTKLFYTKLVLSSLLIASCVAELGWIVWRGAVSTLPPPADIMATIFLLITYVIHIALVCVGRLRGERTSGFLWIYWFIVLLSGIPQLISAFTDVVNWNEKLPSVGDLIFILQYSFSFGLFITNWFCDAPSKLQILTMSKNPSPEFNAGFPSQYMYWYCWPIIWLGWKRPIVFDDLWDTSVDFEAARVSEDWHADFDKKPKCSKDSYNTGKEQDKQKGFLYQRLWRLCRHEIPILLTFYISSEIIRFITPQLLSLLITFTTNLEEPVWHGFLYAISLFVVCELTSVLRNRYFYLGVKQSIKIRAALMAAVYRKALGLSGSARRETTIGQIVNMMAVDAQVVGDTFWQLANLIVAPLIILACTGFLWDRLGPSVLSGLLVLILMIPVNSYLANKTKECQLECIKLRDKRVKMVSEIIGGIKVLKLYAWEDSFAKEVQKVREEEVRYFKQIAFLQSFSAFVFHVSPFLVSMATFTTYLLVSEDNLLDAELAFVSISLFNIMKLPIIQMPSVVAQVIQASVALKRIKGFLASSELDPHAVCSERSEEGHLVIRKGQFSWEGAEGEATWTLRDVELNVKKGKLAAVVGSVGAGKSSLISALLGEMRKDAGKVVVNGSIAYVSQQAWLQNSSLRDNITWGKPYDEKWYRRVIDACALKPDLEMLEGGDMTEVGEKGLNLSGGQKQRISLARAVYRDADIVILDDPLSAVDAHVGKHIFEQVIGPQGLLKSKTRLLVTHSVTFLPQVDEIIVMKDGVLVESGTYDELVEADGDFAQFIVQYLTTHSADEDAEELVEICAQLENIPRGDILRQISHISSTGSHTTSTGEIRRPGSRQRSTSESREEEEKIKNRINGYLSHSNRNLSNFRSDRNLLHRQASHCSSPGFHVGNRAHLYHSRLSLHSKSSIYSRDIDQTSEMEFQMSEDEDEEGEEENAEKEKGNKIITLIDEEMQETGKVARYVYVVYGKAMGAIYAILPFVSLGLGQVRITAALALVPKEMLENTWVEIEYHLDILQGAIAGSNVWLSYWSSSTETVEINAASLNSTSDTVLNTVYETQPISKETFLTGYGLFGIAQAFFIFVGMLLIMLGCLRAANYLHKSLLDSVIRLPMSFFDTNPSGRIINRFSKEVSALDFNLPNIIRSLQSCFTQVVATLIVIVLSTPVAAIALAPIMIVYYLIQVIYVATNRQLKRIESVTKSPVYSHFSESIQGVSIIRAFKKQNEFIQESLNKIDRFLRAVNMNISTNRWVALQLEVLGNLITFAAAMMAVLGRETISPGIVGLSVTYALNITMVLNWLVRIASDLEANIVSVERINEYMQKEKEAEWILEDTTPESSWPEKGVVSFQSYETRYRPGLDLVLKGISCSFKPAEKVGIVGRTGAGKSSLTLALFRLIEPAGGNIEIDGIKVTDIGLHDLRGRLSIIPQDPVLFSGTLRLNLDPFGGHSDADVWRALELAHLKSYVKAQPMGLMHPVDEDGSNFSVGQRQLVCLARALLRQSRVLVLDEATAAVDLETDDLIQDTIRDQFKECTVLTIAHRINTIMDCDRVLVLDHGKIVEFDAPSTLLDNNKSIFHGMAKDAGII